MKNPKPMIRFFSGERLLGFFLFWAALALFSASLSRTPFPGLPAQTLLLHLGAGPAPAVLDPLWGWLARAFARLPRIPVAIWTGGFSALCGAASVALLGRLMARVTYRGLPDAAPANVARENQARLLSGLTAGLFLACCIPFWMLSTRSLPGSFHVLLLLVATWFFSEYQRAGRIRDLGALGLLYGVGIAEFATFIVYLPLALFLVGREMFRRRTWRAWRGHAVFWGGLLLGLLLYPLHAVDLFRQGASAGMFASPWEAWAQILREQFYLIVLIRQAPGFPVIMFFCLAPWLMLFAMSRRSPWFYEGDQVLVRLVFVAGLLGVLYNAPFAPWHLLGMNYPMVSPYVLLAICTGYMAGEFWILGSIHALLDVSRLRRIARRAAGGLALLLPVVVALGGAHNWRVVDGRHGAVLEEAALDVLGRLGDRDIVFSSGLLEDSLNMAIWERRAPVRLVSAPRTTSPLYLRRLADAFPEAALKNPLTQGRFEPFLESLLLSDGGVSRVAIIDMPDAFRGFAHLEPDGLLYRLSSAGRAEDLSARIEAQRPFWRWMEEWIAHPAPEENLARPHQDLLRLVASKVANNLGVMQAERGDEAGALETFRTARRFHAPNISVLLNLLELGRSRELPEAAELEAEWMAFQEKLDAARWALSVRYGYVWKVRDWARRGWAWALSGAPSAEEAELLRPATVDDDPDGRKQLLDRAYLAWGEPLREETHYRARLIRGEKDQEALLALCRLSLRRNDPVAAEAYVVEALAKGLREGEALFDQAMIVLVRDGVEKAVVALEDLAKETPDDARVWMALALLTPVDHPLNEQALRALKSLRAEGLGVRLGLVWIAMSRRQWDEARAELEAAVQTDAKNAKVWEMMVTWARIRGQRKLMEASQRTLLALEPRHPLQIIQNAFVHYRQGSMEKTEAELRAGLWRQRNPDLLNALAHVLMDRDGDLREARSLADEAVRRQPFNPIYRCTRSELDLKEGRLDDAERELKQALAEDPDNIQTLLMSIRIHLARGEKQPALELSRMLVRRKRELTPEQQEQVKALLLQMRSP